MTESEVNAICIGGLDGNNLKVIDVYARQRNRYAVYQTAQRVVVAYADDPLVQNIQRKRLAVLAMLRSEIDGLLAPWREKKVRMLNQLPLMARQYDMRVYPALVEALEGRPDVGLAILQRLRSDIAGDMASRARLAYVAWSVGAACLLLLVCVAFHAGIGYLYGNDALVPETSRRFLLAGMCTGILGALYSTATRVQRRALENELRKLDYVTDSFVRIGLGAIGAFILECFLISGAIEIHFGNGISMGQDGAAGRNFIYLVLIGGFLAGFVERLVPDLLNSYTIVAHRDAAPAPAPAVAPPAPQPQAQIAAADLAAAAKPPGQDEEESVTNPPSAEEDVDGCDAHLDDPAQTTPDENLPPSSSGVNA